MSRDVRGDLASRRGVDRRATRGPVVLVFGESENDRKSIIRLIHGLRPDLAGLVEERRNPLVLIKGARPETARNNAAVIAALARAESAWRDVLAIVAHQDCDAVEPAHEAASRTIEEEIRIAGAVAPAIGVTPAWEIETWWMVFPEAVGKLVKGWRDPDDWLGRDVGQVAGSKEALAKAVMQRPRPKSPPREYQERDSIAIADNIVADRLLPSFDERGRSTPGQGNATRLTRCASFQRFRVKVIGIRAPTSPPPAKSPAP